MGIGPYDDTYSDLRKGWICTEQVISVPVDAYYLFLFYDSLRPEEEGGMGGNGQGNRVFVQGAPSDRCAEDVIIEGGAGGADRAQGEADLLLFASGVEDEDEGFAVSVSRLPFS